MSIKTDFSQLKKFTQSWIHASKEFEIFLEKFLIDMALEAMAEIKLRTPVDTGALLESWKLGEIKRSNRAVEIELINNQEYASFVEYGHETVNGGWVDGRLMMTIGIDEIQKKMPARFHEQFKAWLVENGMA